MTVRPEEKKVMTKKTKFEMMMRNEGGRKK